ncbi:hypothetical protein M5D96_007721 [Drosophila gunungcola]|uniref:E3 ubiquitin-protein ligase DCST1-like C-terminal domain-containing protein n=1 Tax=Drosophila gunungcola TaxID=103775 RepID=A0A9P9YL43_9MUSC|nr:hypothetical protein M5D96_007721 [Drosophila gunungcola]
MYKKSNKLERQRWKHPNEGDEENISENSSVLQTGKAVNNSYKNSSSHTQGQLQRNSNYDLDREQAEYSKNRNQSPEGDAPIYPFNSPEDTRDPQPECNPADRGLKSHSNGLGNPLPYIIAGYIVGILLVLFWYYRNPQKACIDLNEKWVFAVLLFLLLLILIQRRPARCIAALCFSSLASYQFRAVVIALAFLMACSGPVRNIIHNICIMANTLYCGQNVLIRALRLMQRIINDPSHSVEESFQGVLTDIRKLMNKLDKLLIKLERPIAKIHATYKICADWLGVQRDHFDYKMGTPYNRCMKAGNLSITQCKNEFGVKTKDCCNKERFNWFCDSLKTLKTFFNDNLQWSQVLIEEIFQRIKSKSSGLALLHTKGKSGCRRSLVGKCCIICSKPLTKWDYVPCDLPTCRGIYCKMCFQECNNLCILCSSRCDSDIFQGISSECEADTCISDINFQERDKNA